LKAEILIAMHTARYVKTLSRHLMGLQVAAHQLAEARHAGLETVTDEARFLHQLTDYGWAVRNRVWLISPAYRADGQLLPVAIEELHIRLVALETLVQLRLGQLPSPPAEPADLSPATHELVQRLAAAENRLFHLYQLFPLN
jgi:hypothetical protein